MSEQSVHRAISNRLLASLPPAELAIVEPHLSRVTLPPRQLLYASGQVIEHAYFPESGMLALVLPVQDGRSVEIAPIGAEGVFGYGLATERGLWGPAQVVVQQAGEFWRIPRATMLDALSACPVLTHHAREFADLVLAIAGQNVACGHFHELTARLARRLLTVADIIGSTTLLMTQEVMAEMLGTNRPTVTLAAHTLSNAGLIRYSRGTIEILDAPALEDSACECYGILRTEYERLGTEVTLD